MHHVTVHAKPALHGLHIDPSSLNWMGSFRCADALQCRNLGFSDGADRLLAGANRLSFDNHRASTALPQPTTKTRTVKLKIVPQDIKQRSFGLDLHGVAASI